MQDFFQLFKESKDEKEAYEYFNSYNILKNECLVYKFFLSKHLKTITLEKIQNRFKGAVLNYTYVYIIKKDKKNLFYVKPLVWINQDVLIKYNKEPLQFFRSYKIRGTERAYILTERKNVPFYLMKKYGRKQGVEKEIFNEVKYLRKQYNELNNKVINERKKKERRLRKKNG